MTFSNELVSKLRRLSPEEYETLETSCLKNGIQDPIKVWGNILIDGRHRLEIAQKHDLPYRMEQVAFADEAEATKWIWEFQLGRRNHTEMETHRARAELARLTSIKEAADSHGVSVRTIARDITASAAMDLMDSDLLEKCESGQIVNSMSDWKRYGQLTSEEREKANQKLRSNPELTLREVMPPKNMVLDDDDLAFVNSLVAFDHKIKRAIATGSIDIKPADVKKLRKLSGGDLEILAEILKDEAVTSFKKALQVLGGTPKNNNPEDALSSAKYHLALAIDRAIEKARDVETFGVNMDNAINTLKQIKACL